MSQYIASAIVDERFNARFGRIFDDFNRRGLRAVRSDAIINSKMSRMKKNPFEQYMKKFSEQKLWIKVKNYARQAGLKAIYSVLLLFYAYRRKETPAWAKNIIIGTLGYFLSPIDFIPDLSPIIGYTDDVGVLSFGLVTIAAYINKEVRSQAREKLGTWFGDYDDAELAAVDEKL